MLPAWLTAVVLPLAVAAISGGAVSAWVAGRIARRARGAEWVTASLRDTQERMRDVHVAGLRRAETDGPSPHDIAAPVADLRLAADRTFSDEVVERVDDYLAAGGFDTAPTDTAERAAFTALREVLRDAFREVI